MNFAATDIMIWDYPHFLNIFFPTQPLINLVSFCFYNKIIIIIDKNYAIQILKQRLLTQLWICSLEMQITKPQRLQFIKYKIQHVSLFILASTGKWSKMVQNCFRTEFSEKEHLIMSHWELISENCGRVRFFKKGPLRIV